MVKIDYKGIGIRIKAARMAKKLTQEQLASSCEVSTQHISNIENDKTKVSLPLLIDIANVLNVSLDQLVCDILTRSEAVYAKEVEEVFADCDIDETRLLVQALKSTKQILSEQKKILNKKG